MKKYISIIAIILISSCSPTRRMEKQMFNPQRKGHELREQRKFEKEHKQKKKWVSQQKRK